MERKTHFPNYMISVIAIVICWLVLELISLIVYRHLPNRFNNGKRIVELNTGVVPATPASMVSHPYMLYANSPNYHIDGFQQHNSLGYRSDEFNPEKDPNTIRILALGGSTTYGYLNPNPKTTWPALLQTMLQAHTSKKVEVINGGLKYGTSAELLSSYVFRHRFIKPDIIIFHEGGNDAIPVLFPDYNPEYTHFRGHGSGAWLRGGEKNLLHSNVFKVFYSLWLNSYETIYKAQPFSLDEVDRKEAEKRVDDNRNFSGFTRNVDFLMRLAEMDSVQVVLFGFVHAREKYLSRNREDMVGLEKTLVRSIEKNKDIMEALARQHGALYIEVDQSLFKDEWFHDHCHLVPEGDAVKAKFVFEHMLPMIADKTSPQHLDVAME
jgi:hypothetical protein